MADAPHEKDDWGAAFDKGFFSEASRNSENHSGRIIGFVGNEWTRAKARALSLSENADDGMLRAHLSQLVNRPDVIVATGGYLVDLTPAPVSLDEVEAPRLTVANYVLDSQKTFSVSPYPVPSVHVAPGCAPGVLVNPAPEGGASRVYLSFTTLSGGPVWMGNAPDVRVGAFAGSGTVSPTVGPGDITAEWWATSDTAAQFQCREIVLVSGADSVFVSRLPTVDLTGVVAGVNGPTLTVRT